MRGAHTLALALVLVAGTGACGGERVETTRAVEIARAHGEQIASFERWAARIAASDTGFGDRAALEEAAFAPVRGDRSIAGAWIERQGPDPHLLAHPRGAALPELAWRRARVGTLGEVEVATAPEREYVRTTRDAPGGASLVVTIAFRAEAAAE